MTSFEIVQSLVNVLQLPFIGLVIVFAYRIGAIARPLLYLALILLAKYLLDFIFIGQHEALYAAAESADSKMALALLWYSFFILTEAISVFALYTFVTTEPMLIRGYLRLFIFCALVRSGLYFFRASEIAWFESNYTFIPYTYGILSMDYLINFAILWGLVQCYRRSKLFGERIAWTA